MPSPTQRQLTVQDVAAYAREAFAQSIVEAAPIGGGTFAAVWRVRLDDGRDVVLKVGPRPDVRLLRYEADMIPSEAAYYRMVAGLAPVPTVLHEGDDWIFVTLLPGVPLGFGEPAPTVRSELGAAVARVHTVTGERFGYPGDRPHATDWPTAFAAMVEAMLADAVDWDVSLPVAPQRVREVVSSRAALLKEVTTPVLVHFDLWDGNVLHDNGRLTGMVDGERYLYGDPLFDFVSPALFQRIEDVPDHPFVRGYGPGIELDPERLSLYRMYLYLLMVTEVPSRCITDPARIDFLRDNLAREVSFLD
ncbi:aminoglycoside phosphotransferase family protein [Allorhizocola rhizosphaerae]|uniref:aminoglycoside phosphotransferase family protein n=1 Tax=Allorhizocola rhizosphaerae TaxID=1872709 RepID=UPI001FEA30B7|nr:aminoglycoside phosphotransferase family protein [Allorhizocola rhizosphaerae]